MKQTVILLALIVFCFKTAPAQTTDTSVCDILNDPASFDGKLVRLKGTVTAGFEDFAIKDESCKSAVKAIWLSYPEGTKGKAGPVAVLQFQLSKGSVVPAVKVATTAVTLNKNEDFKQFDSLLATPFSTGGMCLGCNRYSVSATLLGRLDGVKYAGVTKDGAGKFTGISGFGNLNIYTARLVLQSVTNVTPKEIDYSKVSTIGKEPASKHASGGDPVAAAHHSALALGAGSAPAAELERAAAAFGKQGEDNGVNIGFGVANEVSKSDGEPGEGNSPDGLLSNCTFNTDRLKGDGLYRAIVHMGTHIADVRAGESAGDPRGLEANAWQTTVIDALATRQKTLTLSGGYLIWNEAWVQTDRGRLHGEAVDDYLTNWEALGK